MDARPLFRRCGRGHKGHGLQLVRIDVDGQNTCIPAHRFDHILTLVFGTGSDKIKNNDRAVALMLQGQLVVGMIAEKRAQESQIARIRHVRRQLDAEAHGAGFG